MLTTNPSEGSVSHTATWLDVLNPSDDERAKSRAEYGIDIPSRQQLEEIESSSRL